MYMNKDVQEGVGKDLVVLRSFRFGTAGEILSWWVFSQKGRSAGCFSASLKQVFTPTSDS